MGTGQGKERLKWYTPLSNLIMPENRMLQRSLIFLPKGKNHESAIG